MQSETRRRRHPIYTIEQESSRTFRDISELIPSGTSYNLVRYRDFAEFLDSLDGLDPGCVVLEADAIQLSQLALARSRSAASPALSLILIGERIDVATVVEAVKVSSLRFLERPFDASHLLNALAEGFASLDSAMQMSAADRAGAEQLASLTPRERAVFEGLIDGLSNKEIAKRLSISHRTVEVYRANLAVKLHSKKPTDWVRLKLSLPPGTSIRIIEDEAPEVV